MVKSTIVKIQRCLTVQQKMPSQNQNLSHFPEDEPMMGGEDPLQPTGLENEFKTVPGVQAPAPEPLTTALPTEPMMEPEDDEGVFFGDAPEQRVKKTAYN
jgi:hypothetical protein